MKRKKKSIPDEIEEEVEDIEKWVYQRREFFRKLAWVAGFIAVLLIFSHFYLRVSTGV